MHNCTWQTARYGTVLAYEYLEYPADLKLQLACFDEVHALADLQSLIAILSLKECRS
jgi:hypothetical protein